MTSLITTDSLTRDILGEIWRLVPETEPLGGLGPVACSFQGSGVRTRTTFCRALQELGLPYIDLPPFLDTEERVQDLAGYLDPFYSLYIVRHQDHERLAAFAQASARPVLNAMSSREHPCEGISDAYWFHSEVKPLAGASIVLWGPTTNVLRSWRNVAETAGARVHRIQDDSAPLPEEVDLVVTDGWPDEGPQVGLQWRHLEQMGGPLFLPTPPFTIGRELTFDPVVYPGFVGYKQKEALLPVQKAILRYALRGNTGQPLGASPRPH